MNEENCIPQTKLLKSPVVNQTSVTHSRKRKCKTQAEKLEANRKSAAESRYRKKMMLRKLQEEVIKLRNENAILRIENADLMKMKRILNLSIGEISSSPISGQTFHQRTFDNVSAGSSFYLENQCTQDILRRLHSRF